MPVQYLALGCWGVTAVTFAVATVGKVRSVSAFTEFVSATRAMLSGTPLASPRAARATAVVTAAAEILVPVLLLAVPVAGFALAGGLLAAFCAGVSRALRRGTRQPCRCFGGVSAPLGRRHAVRAGALGLVAISGAAATGVGGPEGVTALLAGVDPGGALVVGVVAVTTALLSARLDDLVGLFAAPGYRRALGVAPLERN